MTFDKILEIENDPEILNFTYASNKVPMYLMIRHYYLQSLIDDEFQLTDYSPKSKVKFFELLKYAFISIWSNLFSVPKHSIIVFSSDIVYKKVKGIFVNRLYDKFLEVSIEKMELIVKSTSYINQLPKQNKVYYNFIAKLLIQLLSKFKKTNFQDIENINLFLSYLNKNFPDKIPSSQENKIKNSLLVYANRLDSSLMIYTLLFKRIKPKLVFVEDGHYLGEQLPIILAAKKLGIEVGEFQHGYVGLAHRSYNFSSKIQPLIKQYLPDYFLTYGKYWSDNIRIPGKKIIVGNPGLIDAINSISKPSIVTKSILFISGGTVYDKLIETIVNACEPLNKLGYNLFLRPHPLESKVAETRYKNVLNKGVKLDTQDLFKSISESEIVISLEMTTVLFEALCFTRKVYLKESKYTKFYNPLPSFLTFISTEQLISFIESDKKIDQSSEYYWENDYRSKYDEFIKKIIK